MDSISIILYLHSCINNFSTWGGDYYRGRLIYLILDLIRADMVKVRINVFVTVYNEFLLLNTYITDTVQLFVDSFACIRDDLLNTPTVYLNGINI